VLRACFDHEEADEREHAECAGSDVERTPTLRGTLDERVDDTAEPERERRGTGEVDLVVGVRIEGLRHVAEGQHHRERHERQVDEEDGPPRHRLDQPPAQKGTGRGRHAAEPAPPSYCGAAIFRPKRRGDDREAARHEQRGRDALHAAGGDQCDGRGRERAEE
jgi:hypothetical protein